MPLTNPVTIRFDEEELRALKDRAEREDRPLGYVVRKAIRRSLFLPDLGINGADTGDSVTEEREEGGNTTPAVKTVSKPQDGSSE